MPDSNRASSVQLRYAILFTTHSRKLIGNRFQNIFQNKTDPIFKSSVLIRYQFCTPNEIRTRTTLGSKPSDFTILPIGAFSHVIRNRTGMDSLTVRCPFPMFWIAYTIPPLHDWSPYTNALVEVLWRILFLFYNFGTLMLPVPPEGIEPSWLGFTDRPPALGRRHLIGLHLVF